MWNLLVDYWPHILATLSVVMASAAISHAVMTKDEVRAAIGWVGVILLSPILGALVYAIAGINRIRRASIASVRRRTGDAALTRVAPFDVPRALIADLYGEPFAAMKTLGDRVTRHPMTKGNRIAILKEGDETYAQMIAAIDAAERSVILETYIFDRDRIGQRVAASLIEAGQRGVEVRVLIDAVGARYSNPSIVSDLTEGGVPLELFNGQLIAGLRLPYANLRTHRKILVVDGTTAFAGGMNIREAFTRECAGEHFSRDTHFRLGGPVVTELLQVAAHDWHFASGHALEGEAWRSPPPSTTHFGTPAFARAVPSGPDASVETNHRMLMGAFSVAQRSIRIQSPYFLPDRELIAALATAARRGVDVDIVIPAKNNLLFVERAMLAQMDQVLKNYCRVWRASGPFDHSKLLCVDGAWAFIGSSNLDPRSLRLNFEIDIEVLDDDFADEIDRRIEKTIEEAQALTLEDLRARPFPVRLIDRLLWLGSPYL